MSLFSCMLFVFVAENGLHGQEIVITPASQLSEVDEDNEIVIIRNEKKYPTHINFVSKASGEICKSIDVAKSCPFEQLPFPVIRDPFFSKKISDVLHFKKYNLENIDYKTIVNTLLPNVKDAFLRPCKPYTTKTYYSVFTSKNKETVILNYGISLYGEGGGVVAGSNHIYKYNKKGELLLSIENMNESVGGKQLTEDGRYLAYRHGGFGGPHGDCVVGGSSPYGLKIIDTYTGEIIARENMAGKNPSDTRLIEKMFVLTNGLRDRSYEYIFYNFEKNKRYAKTYSFEERWHLKDITAEGMLFYDMADTSKRKMYWYEKDFIQKPIK